MTPQKQKKGDKKMKTKPLATIALVLVLIFPSSSFASVFANDIVCVFKPGSEKNTINNSMIEGSVRFLASKAQADLLLMEYEISSNKSFNVQNALQYCRKAIEELEIALTHYNYARDIGIQIGYIEAKRTMFQTFQYDTYTVEKGLNYEIANNVKRYLQKMDIVGIYNKNIENVNSILVTAKDIESVLKLNKKPGIQVIWKLLQQYAEATLFGNYSTVIGGSVLSNSEDGPPICDPN